MWNTTLNTEDGPKELESTSSPSGKEAVESSHGLEAKAVHRERMARKLWYTIQQLEAAVVSRGTWIRLSDRVRYLMWQVQVEMLEIIATTAMFFLGLVLHLAAVQIVSTPSIDQAFHRTPDFWWSIFFYGLALVQGAGLLFGNLRLRCVIMFIYSLVFAACWFISFLIVYRLGPTLLGVSTLESYAIYTFSASWSHVRLRKELRVTKLLRSKSLGN